MSTVFYEIVGSRKVLHMQENVVNFPAEGERVEFRERGITQPAVYVVTEPPTWIINPSGGTTEVTLVLQEIQAAKL